MKISTILCLFFIVNTALAQVTITIDPLKDVKPISPYLYGRNNSLPKESFATPLTSTELTRLRESGVRMLREGGGNNATKYNWRKRLSSHPDWYNNVYTNDWDISVKTLQDSLPENIQGMWTFQLIGKAAKTNAANFGDWNYNRSQWWEGVNQNLAGGGQLNPTGTKAKVEGDPNQYLEDWPADSTVGIINHWTNTLKIPKQRFQYWNMDNEPEIWYGSHDDIVSNTLNAEQFMQRYFDVAKKARAKFPEVKIVGPVVANEWQWYNWASKIVYNGKTYPWLEFFIKRCADEQQATGIKLLDVFDIHFYPNETAADDVVQLHRVFFDRNFVYKGANGVRTINGGYDVSLTKEYILARANDWLVQYMGANHGVKLGVTEIGVETNDPSVSANWYASVIGEFMRNEVEIFTPWTWKIGMWETLHLFARYNKTHSISSISNDETLVSAYPSVNVAKDSMTIMFVNRSTTASKTVTTNFTTFNPETQNAEVLTIKSLPSTETFMSHTNNALNKSTIAISNKVLNITLPPLSVTAVILKGRTALIPTQDLAENTIKVYPNPFSESFKIELKNGGFSEISVFDVSGKKLLFQQISPLETLIDVSAKLPAGVYALELKGENSRVVKKIVSF